ncbi:uncharacterized protein N7529_010803 [Penicillium soppii]|uniref:uncharacterized protein n=1 Tax=Penicillium soppii TaxID=69789 RepID=UPI002547656C|nr:uncharacterized protein N7529_010803 [Penicillium soppii]KAJ5851418.1 hypothetical protein N7529_010803 [Penicillium soppii]
MSLNKPVLSTVLVNVATPDKHVDSEHQGRSGAPSPESQTAHEPGAPQANNPKARSVYHSLRRIIVSSYKFVSQPLRNFSKSQFWPKRRK